MISVQNLRLPSNGNRKTFLFLLLASLSISCELFQPVQSTAEKKNEDSETLDPIQGNRIFDATTGEWVVVKDMPTEPMDTVRWKEIPENISPPITSTGTYSGTDPGPIEKNNQYGSEFFSTYNVVVLLPFLTDRFNSQSGEIDPNSNWAIHFYGGLKMALNELSGEGVSLNVSALDTKVDESQLGQLLRSNQDLQKAHLIIGPYRQNNIKAVADFAARSDISLVSPYSAATDLTSANPNYIQVSPTLNTHCEVITRHALSHYRPDQIVLVSTDDPAEKERLRFFQEAYFRQAGSRNAEKLEEYVVSSSGSDFSNLDVMPFIQLKDTTVFLIPSWNESFIYSFLRKADLSKEPYHEVVVYGMPQWMFFDHIDPDYYEKLHVRVSSNYYLDPLAPSVQFFKRRYFDQYGTIAPMEAYLGYDVMLYFGRMLKKHGTKFQYLMDGEPAQVLHTRYEFEQVVIPSTTGAEQLPIQRFENKFVNILKFEDYQFQLSN